MKSTRTYTMDSRAAGAAATRDRIARAAAALFLEHAYEDGDRANYDHEFAEWQAIVERRQTLLERHGLAPMQAGVRAEA